MNRPFLSFSIAVFFWFFLLGIFYFSIFKKSEAPPVSLVIDAAMISENEQEKKSTQKVASKEVGDEKIKREETSAEKVQNDAQKKMPPLYSPLPKIPDDLREEAFNSSAVARFYIAQDGSVTSVELIHPCNNPRLNKLLLTSLKNWKFAAAQNHTQDIRVNFEVK